MTDAITTLVCKKRKSPEERDTVTILAGDRATVIKAWDHGIMPHEIVHYVVEAVFGLRGFVQLTAEGISSERMIAEKDPQAMQAESLTNAYQYEMWGLTPATDEQFLENAGRHAPLPDGTPERIREGRELIAELSIRWDELPAGGTMELALPPGSGQA